MYKEAQEYVEVSSDSVSDEISDPEDIIDSTDHDEEEDSIEEELEPKQRSTRRSTTGNKRDAKATEVKSRKKTTAEASSSSRAKGKDKETVGKSTQQTITSKPLPKGGRVADDSSPVLAKKTSVKRKISETKFSPLELGQHSPSSSGTSSARRQVRSSPSTNRRAFDALDDQWTEKYAPRDTSELAVNNTKIDQVREWLRIYTDPRRSREAAGFGGAILVLTGPAGSGKTVVIQMLAKEMGLEIVEWINNVNENNIIRRPTLPGQDSWRSSSFDDEYVPVMNAFQEFFTRAHRFNPLLLGDSTDGSKPPTEAPRSASGKKNIILIEDLPPISAYSSRKIFQETILNFANTRSSTSSVLVIIISDVFSKQSTELLFSSNENREQALSIRTLLPAALLDRLDSGVKTTGRVKQIKFNAIAMRFMTKAINAIVNEEFVHKRSFAPEKEEIDQLIEIHGGDIRAVINSLQFLCSLPLTSRRRYREAARILEEDPYVDPDMKMQYGQDSSLGIFHAVAKVLYNKRDWSNYEEYDLDIIKIPPQDFKDHKLRPKLHFNPEKDLIEKLPVEPDLFTLMLHQNYARHLNDIFECSTAMDYLCISEQFSSPPNVNFAQMAQMQPYMTSLAVRSVLFAPTRPSRSLGSHKTAWWPELFSINKVQRTNDQSFSEVAVDLRGEEAKGLSSGHITGPGFFPKAVVREEIVPMLSRCASANPYLSIFQKIRPSSKAFIRSVAGVYGRKSGVSAREFGEGDEGFLEEIT
ncbi:Cell cycle checkpoint protein rad17, partial [Podila epigama]